MVCCDIVFGMKEFTISFAKSNKVEAYISDCLEWNGIEFKVTNSEKFGKIYINLRSDEEAEIVRNIICDVIILFCKSKKILDAIKVYDPTPIFGAFVGSALLFGKEDEITNIKKHLTALGSDSVNIEGFLNFRLNNMNEDWEGVANLVSKLYNSCRSSEEDLVNCACFLSNNTNDEPRPKVCYEGEANQLFIDVCPIAMASLFGEKELDVLCNMMYHRPSVIKVWDPSKTPKEIMRAVKAFKEEQEGER